MPANAASTNQALTDPSLVHQLQGLKDRVHDVTFHPESHQVAAACNDGAVLIWDLQHPNVRAYKFCGHSEAVTSVCFSTSGDLLASCSRDKLVRLWKNGVEGRSVEFKAHTGAIRSVHFSPGDSDRLITSSEDKSIKMWTTQGHRFVRSYTTHNGWVRCAKFSPSGELIASVSDDKTIRLFDADSDKEIHVFNELKGHAVHLDWHPGASCLGVATSDKKVKVYDIRMLKLQQVYGTHEGAVSQVSFHPSGNYMASGSDDGSLKIYDLLEGRPIYDLLGHRGSVTSVKFSKKGDYFASGESEKLVFVWKTNFDNAIPDGNESAPLPSAAKAPSKKIPEKPDSTSGALKEKTTAKNADQYGVSSAMEKMSIHNKENNGKNAADQNNRSSDSAAVAKLSGQMNQMMAKMDTLTQTLLMMEKRLTLVEEQMQLSVSSTSSSR